MEHKTEATMFFEKLLSLIEKSFAEPSLTKHFDPSQLGSIIWYFAFHYCSKNAHVPKLSLKQFLSTTDVILRNHSKDFIAFLTNKKFAELHAFCDRFDKNSAALKISANILKHTKAVETKGLWNDHMPWILVRISLQKTLRAYLQNPNDQDSIEDINQGVNDFILERTLNSIHSQMNTSVCNAEWDELAAYFETLVHVLESSLNNTLLLDWRALQNDLAQCRAPFIKQIEDCNIADLDQSAALSSAQRDYSTRMDEFLTTLIQRSNNLLGIAPCEFLIIKLGSLARNEMGVYSDLEYAIVLPDGVSSESVNNYFNDWIKLFQYQIDLLGEHGGEVTNEFKIVMRKGLHIDDGISPVSDGKNIAGEIGSAKNIFARCNAEWLLSQDKEKILPVMYSLSTASKLSGSDQVWHSFCTTRKKWLYEQVTHGNQLLRRHQLLGQLHFCEHLTSLKSVHDQTLAVNAFYFKPKHDWVYPLSFIANDIALYFGIDSQGLSSTDIIQKLVDINIVSTVFSALWKQSLMFAIGLRLKGEVFDGQQCDPAYIVLSHPKKAAMQGKKLSQFPAVARLFRMHEDDYEKYKRFSEVMEAEGKIYPCTPQSWEQFQHYSRWVVQPIVHLNLNILSDDNRLFFDPLLSYCASMTWNAKKNIVFLESLSHLIVLYEPDTSTHARYYRAISLMQEKFNQKDALRLAFYQALENEKVNPDVLSIIADEKDERGVSLSMAHNTIEWSKQLQYSQGHSKLTMKSVMMGECELDQAIVKQLCQKPPEQKYPYFDIRKGTFNTFLAKHQEGNHLTVPIKNINDCPDFHIKINPEYPPMEQAVALLANLIMGTGMPPSDFWEIICKNKITPVIISKTVHGTPLNKLLSDNPNCLDDMSDEDYSLWLLFTLLIDPEDAKPDNFIGRYVTVNGKKQLKLWCVDNDRAFVPPETNNKIRIKSIFYYANQLKKPISPKAKKAFLHLDARQLVLFWFARLRDMDNAFPEKYSLTTKTEVKGSMGRLLLHKHLSLHLIEKIQIIQEMLRGEKALVHEDLVKRMHSWLYTHNQQYDKEVTVYAHFKAATKNQYRHKTNVDGVTQTATSSSFKQYWNDLWQNCIPPNLINKTSATIEEESKAIYRILADSFQIERAQEHFLNKQFVLFESLSTQEMERLLTTIDWTQQKKTMLYWQYLSHPPHDRIRAKLKRVGTLKLDGAKIDNAELNTLLKAFPNLISLSLKECKNITGDAMGKIIMKRCPALRSLDLSKTGISVMNANTLFSTKPLVCEPLERLILNECGGLSDIYLKAPMLKRCEIHSHQQIKASLDTPNLQAFLFGSSLYTDDVETRRFAISQITASKNQRKLVSCNKAWIKLLFNSDIDLTPNLLAQYGFKNGDWMWIDVSGADLSWANLKGLHMQGASFGGTKWSLRSGTLKEHTTSVRSVAFSPDGATLASGSWEHTFLWDVKTKRCIATLNEHIGEVYSVAFSPDGASLAWGNDDKIVRLWDLKKRRCIAMLNEHTSSVLSVAFSPDGATLASGSGDKTIRLWDVKTKRCIATFNKHTDSVNSVAFSPDGSKLVSASSDGTFRLWDVKTKRRIATLNEHRGEVHSVAFSPDGASLASGNDDKIVRLWDLKKRRCIAMLNGHTSSVLSVAFSPDGATLASGSGDKTIRLWDVKTKRCIATLQGHTYPVRSVAFSPDGTTLASGSNDKTVQLWDMTTLPPPRADKTPHTLSPPDYKGLNISGAKALTPGTVKCLKSQGAIGEPAPYTEPDSTIEQKQTNPYYFFTHSDSSESSEGDDNNNNNNLVVTQQTERSEL